MEWLYETDPVMVTDVVPGVHSEPDRDEGSDHQAEQHRPPPASRETPMITMMVSVTSGGKSLMSIAKTGAIRIMNNPDAITAP